jgi:glc operon protein GlcG
MPNFGNALSQADVDAIHAFVIDIARKEQASPAPQANAEHPLAQRMISNCEVFAAQNKLTPLSIAVVDESGSLVAFTRQKGASPISAEVALAKAKSAARVGAPTAVLADVAAENQAARDTYSLMQLVAMPGGWPLADSDGTIRGGVGVSGALPKDDSACAQHAVESTR